MRLTPQLTASQCGRRSGRRSNIRLYCPARGTEERGYSTGKLSPGVEAYHKKSILTAVIFENIIFLVSQRLTTPMCVAAYAVT